MLEVAGLQKRISAHFALENISFQQSRGECLAIAGSSGSGKSTLLRLIAGHESPDSGSIHLFGQRVLGPHEQLIPGHAGLKFLPQHCHLPHHYFVRELFSYANQWEGEQGKALFELCRIGHLMDRKHTEISGGEQQRIALALLLISSPQWLLLDEPFSHLDPINKSILQQVLNDVARQFSITYLLCSHHPEDIFAWANRLLILRDGKIVSEGQPASLYFQPTDAYVAGLLGDYQELSIELSELLNLPTPKSLRNRLVRPEMLEISPDPSFNAVEAVITHVRFAGKGTFYEVNCLNQTYRVFKTGDVLPVGTRVFLSIHSGNSPLQDKLS